MIMTMSVVLADDVAHNRAAIAGFLAGYCGATRRSYAIALRIAAWCGEAASRSTPSAAGNHLTERE